MSEARLRPWRPDDTPALSTVFRDCVRLSPAHPAAVRHAWAPDDIDTAAWNDRQTRHWTHVAVDADDRLLGFIELAGGAPTGHVDMLFVAPAAQGQGLAGALLAAAETAARARGMTRLTTEASHAARPVFHRAGFRTLYPRTLWRAGQWLHNTAMAKDLAEDP